MKLAEIIFPSDWDKTECWKRVDWNWEIGIIKFDDSIGTYVANFYGDYTAL